jgi:DNA-directed RNA polymerase subunit RPC12/RpoP
MDVLQEFKCPCCDGSIEFDSRSQNMRCPYCSNEFDVDTLMSYQEDLNAQGDDDMQWDMPAGQAWTEDEATGLRTYACEVCGGEIIGDAAMAATQCPFCGSSVVMKAQFAGDLKPDLVIPFKVDKQQAKEALKKHYAGKRLLPKVFKDESRVREVKGMYVPFWLFDADAEGFVRYKATRVRTWSNSEYRYTETSHYSVLRSGGLGFAHVPVDGSSKMDDTLMESIEPFDLSEAVDFHTAYLSGYLADKYDVDAESSIQRANERIKRSTEEAFADTVMGYHSVIPVNTNISLSNGIAKYALCPVWILNTQWNGKNYTFAMNAQTGKLVGDLPVDKVAYWKWLLGVASVVAAVAYALSYLFWLL